MQTLLQYWLPVALWAVVIALLSGSEFHPGFTLRWLQAGLELFFPDLSAPTLLKINAGVRKLAHVTEYFILALLVWRALRQGAAAAWRWSWALGTLAAGVAWAAADELHQLFQRGRSGSLADVGYDSLGVLLALLLVYGWGQWREKLAAGPRPH